MSSYQNYQNESSYQVIRTVTDQKMVGSIDDKDYMVVQRSRGTAYSDLEKQHYYEELVQDNRRMRLICDLYFREVIEQLEREVKSYKASQSTDVSTLRKELLATQKDLDEATKQLHLLQQQSDSKYKAELDKLRGEMESWKTKYQEIEEREKANAAALKELNYYKGRVQVFENDAKKKYLQSSSYEETQKKFDEQLRVTQSLEYELQQWMSKYDALMLEYKELLNSINQNETIKSYEKQIADLIQEVKNWKARCRQIEEEFNTYTNSKGDKAEIERLKGLLNHKDNQLNQWQSKIQEHDRNHMSLSQLKSQNAEYEDELMRLQAQLDKANNKLRDNEKELGELRVFGTVFTQEKFDEMQETIWRLEKEIDVLTKDNDTFMAQLRAYELQIEELHIKYSQYDELIENPNSRYKTVANLEREVAGLQQDLEVWKNRYFQTEIRLKEFDKLKADYDALLLKSRTSTTQINTQITNNSITSSQEYLMIKSEKDNLQRKVYELEDKIRQMNLNIQSFSSTTNRITDDSKVKELTDLLQLKNKQIQDLELMIKQGNMQSNSINQQQVKQLELQIQSLQQENSRLNQQRAQEIRASNQSFSSNQEILKVKAERDKLQQEVYELQNKIREITIKQQQSTTTQIISTSMNNNNQRIIELESKISTLELEIERLQNIKRDQENKIQQLITKVTEYESQINIIKQENVRLSRKSPSRIEQRQQSTNVLIQQPYPTMANTAHMQNASFTQQITRNIYPSDQQSNSSVINNEQTIVRQLTAQEGFSTSQYVGGSKYIATTQSQQPQQPQIIVSQYKPQQL